MKIPCYISKPHVSNAHPNILKSKDKNFQEKHKKYLPTEEKTFKRF